MGKAPFGQEKKRKRVSHDPEFLLPLLFRGVRSYLRAYFLLPGQAREEGGLAREALRSHRQIGQKKHRHAL